MDEVAGHKELDASALLKRGQEYLANTNYSSAIQDFQKAALLLEREIGLRESAIKRSFNWKSMRDLRGTGNSSSRLAVHEYGVSLYRREKGWFEEVTDFFVDPFEEVWQNTKNYVDYSSVISSNQSRLSSAKKMLNLVLGRSGEAKRCIGSYEGVIFPQFYGHLTKE